MHRLLILIPLMFAGCSHSIHLIHTSDFGPYTPLSAGKVVMARSEQFVVMGFVTQTDYVQEAYRKLQENCSHGNIKGITTQYSTSHGFFSWTNKILMTGLCVG